MWTLVLFCREHSFYKVRLYKNKFENPKFWSKKEFLNFSAQYGFVNSFFVLYGLLLYCKCIYGMWMSYSAMETKIGKNIL